MTQPLRYTAYLLLGYYVFAAQLAHADLVIEIYGKPYVTKKAAPQPTQQTTDESSDAHDDEEDDDTDSSSADDQDTDTDKSDTTSDKPSKTSDKKESSFFGKLLDGIKK